MIGRFSCDFDKLGFVLHVKVAILGIYEVACLPSSNVKDKMFRITIKALSLSKTVVLFTGHVYQNFHCKYITTSCK